MRHGLELLRRSTRKQTSRTLSCMKKYVKGLRKEKLLRILLTVMKKFNLQIFSNRGHLIWSLVNVPLQKNPQVYDCLFQVDPS